MTTNQRESCLRKLGEAIKEILPDQFGFVLVVALVSAEIVDGGDYVSDLRREGAIALLRDTADRLESKSSGPN